MRVTRSAAAVSPITTPIRKAPAAGDSPSSVAHSARRKQNPRLATSRVSSDRSCDNHRITLEPSMVPITSTTTQKMANFPANRPASARLAVPVVASPASTVSRITAAKSSTRRMPTMVWPQVELRLPASRRPFNRMAELLMAMAPPRKSPWLGSMPGRMLAIQTPNMVSTLISMTPMISTRNPMLRMRRQPSSRPMPNSRRINPSSASNPMVSRLVISGVGSVYGPISMPATR